MFNLSRFKQWFARDRAGRGDCRIQKTGLPPVTPSTVPET